MKQAAHIRAFSLTELLLVVAVIVMLAVLLLSALVGGKQRAARTACLSNQKQLALAIIMYAESFDDVMPSDGAQGNAPQYGATDMWLWWNGVEGGAKYEAGQSPILLMSRASTNMAICPADRHTPREDPIARKYFYSYSMNGHMDGAGNPDGAGSHHGRNDIFRPRMIYSIHRPADIVLLAEEPVSAGDLAAGFTECADDGRWQAPENSFTTRHSRRGNASFVDGHAQWVDNSYATNVVHFVSTQ